MRLYIEKILLALTQFRIEASVQYVIRIGIDNYLVLVQKKRRGVVQFCNTNSRSTSNFINHDKKLSKPALVCDRDLFRNIHVDGYGLEHKK